MRTVFFIMVIIPLISIAQNNDKEMMSKKGMDENKHIPKGLQIGESAPNIESYSVAGKLISSSNILEEKQIVLIFYRGKWCPICNRYLSNLNDSLQYITAENAEIIVVGPESFESAKKMSQKSNADYVLIPDTSLKILEDYDVLFSVTKKYQGKIKTFLMTDIAQNNGQEEAVLPVPATYIIGKDGVVKWRHFDYDYSVRATAKEIIDNLK
ncbi:MAG: peroxiredoxin-like family protein [Vicingaceae bacterium]|nr:peroxiredoxin-like family protein [Vicingaceae bacterium]